MQITWPIAGFVAAFVVSIVTGAIQLGAVQTHVVINTARLDLLEAREREHLVSIATIQARQKMNEDRIKALESARKP